MNFLGSIEALELTKEKKKGEKIDSSLQLSITNIHLPDKVA